MKTGGRAIKKSKKSGEIVIPIRILKKASIKKSGSFLFLRKLFSFPKKSVFARLSTFALLLIIVSMPLVFAFEAHIINVTATIIQIDPPVITPGSGTYLGPIDIMITDSDPDATHIFYTITPGTDPGLAPDPQCGVYPGGPKDIGPINLSTDSVVKAIACDGDTGLAHGSLITTEIYVFESPFAKIQGRKYHDLDQSGTNTNGDTLIEGWFISLLDSNEVIVMTTVTDVNGYYEFTDVATGTYMVVEEDRDGWEHITPGSVEITVLSNETISINFFNFDTGFACVPEDIDFPLGLAVQAAGSSVLSSNDDVVITNNVTVNGDVRSNDEIEKDNSNGPRTIDGDASATNFIDPIITVTGTKATGTPVVSLPDVMIPVWKLRAQDGGTVNGSFTFPNSTVGLVMGPTEIMGNLIFGSSNSVTIKGPLYIHGNLTIGSNSTIIQDNAFGNNFATIIVDGLIDIDSNVAFVGASTTGTFLLISTHAAVSGADAAIETNSNNSDLGDVVLYASAGDIHIRSNRTLLAIFAAHGTGTDSDANAAILIDSNVTVNYHELPDQVSCGPRQPYESTTHILINEFMPNPTGSDAGVAGGVLDGEWVELFNPTASLIDVAGYVLYDAINTHALPITTANTNTGGTAISSGGYLVVYREGDADFELNNAGGDTARLFSGLIGSGGVLIDSHTYVRDAPDNKSFARVPDGAANWVDPDATPGEPNLFFFEPMTSESTSVEPFEPADKPELVVEEPFIPGALEEPLPEEPLPIEEVLGVSTDAEEVISDPVSGEEIVPETEENSTEPGTTAPDAPLNETTNTEEAVLPEDNSTVPDAPVEEGPAEPTTPDTTGPAEPDGTADAVIPPADDAGSSAETPAS